MAATGIVAGADLATAARLGLSMLCLQAAIGALNDLVDATADTGRKPRKPIPSGSVGLGTALAVVVAATVVGLALTVPSGIGLTVIALVGLGIGFGYDLLARGTAWSWLPFAIGIPLLPVFGWFGATGTLPGWMLVLVPMAALAGAAVAVANARADIERDLDAGTVSVATVLGMDRSWWAVLVLWLVVGALAIGSAALTSGGSPAAPLGIIVAGLLVVLGGVAVGRTGSPERRELGWEIQALGAATAAVGWLLAVTAAA